MEKFGSVRLVGNGNPEDCVLTDACLAVDVVTSQSVYSMKRVYCHPTCYSRGSSGVWIC